MPPMHIMSVRKICNLFFEFSVRGLNVFSYDKRWVFLRLCFRCGLSDRQFYDVFLIRFQGSTVSVGLPVYVL